MDTGGKEVSIIDDNVPGSILFSGNVMQDTESVNDIRTIVELAAYSSEKSNNLSMLMMHVATKESEYEAFILDKELMLNDSSEKVLYLDLLCGILDSEVSEIEHFISMVQTDIIAARKFMVSYKYSGDDLESLKRMSQDAEGSLRQSLEQVSDIKAQSSDIQRNLLRSVGEDTWRGGKVIERLEDDNISVPRKDLKMLERSLAKELDFDKSISESREIKEVLKLSLHSSDHGNLFIEEEDIVVLERLFEGENAAAVLMGISKELLGQIQKLIFSLNASRNREDQLKTKLKDFIHKLKEKDASLQRTESSNLKINEDLLAKKDILEGNLKEVKDELVLVDSEAFTLREKVSSLENELKEYELQLMTAKIAGDKDQNLLQKLHEMRSTQDDLKEKIRKEEDRAARAESKCVLLTESNIELTEELNLLKASGNTTVMVDSLERKMSESDIVLQRAMASAEASQEKENMLNSTIKDMDNLIENLKSKVLKAENLAESAEDKCIELSERNSELTEKLHSLKGKMDCLKVSLHQAEESKKATAKDIRARTKLITEMVVQLAFERERLQKQISSLTKQNKILVNQSQQTSKNQVNMSHNVKEDTDNLTSTINTRNSNSANMDRKDDVDGEPDDCRLDFETVKNIDARQLNVKYLIIMVLVLVISIFAALLFKPPDSGF
ncbi:WPP domain-interacting tail-anchored protein 1 isoform X1 [Daucus carota subsp. sativus]|uniref:WPP domain-interacting tail-anchored protein 1 isoform X1 n=1 Tax=Daucus carota subsp. sativus TaxID=79200 RepID=UPI0007EFB158|nr:PREDICTED: WPP domain-interacting tail-anchored protein 1-like [Daucus carota subsp. sativus]